MSKTFLVAGTSVVKGKIVARFANGTAKAREKVLVKNTDTDIKLFDLPKSLTKEDAIVFLRTNHEAAFSADELAALNLSVTGAAKIVKAAKAPKVKAEKVLREKPVKAARPVSTKTAEEKEAAKASNLEKIKAAAKAMRKRTVKVMKEEENDVVLNFDEDDSHIVNEFTPSERGAFLAEEI